MRPLIVLFILQSLFFTPTITAKESALPKVEKINGTVLINGKTAVEGQMIKKNTLIEAKGPESYVDISLPNKKGMVRFQDAKSIFREMSSHMTKIELLKGRIFTIFKKLLGKDKFRIKTHNSVMGIRGTKFFVEEKEDTYICVCEGEVVAVGSDKIKRSVKVGQDLHIKKGTKTPEAVDATEQMLNMAIGAFHDMGYPVTPIKRRKESKQL